MRRMESRHVVAMVGMRIEQGQVGERLLDGTVLRSTVGLSVAMEEVGGSVGGVGRW